jgi:hypothetical protein
MALVRVSLLAMLVAAILLPPAGAVAQPQRCPPRIAFVENSPGTVRLAETLKAVYGRIGCPDVAFIGLPGRRGAVAFNMGEVQGELMRLPAIEPEYTRAFIRVPNPLNHVTGRLWARQPEQADSGPLGFVLGVVWMEQQGQGRGGLGYPGQGEMFRAYTGGVIDRFLAEDHAVAEALRDGRLAAKPAHAGSTLVSSPLYHYLAVEYAGLVAAIAAELERQRPDTGAPATQ